ncbi:MAG: hypothetical protein ACOYIF_12035, partial [Acetivibrionales bacterium]
ILLALIMAISTGACSRTEGRNNDDNDEEQTVQITEDGDEDEDEDKDKDRDKDKNKDEDKSPAESPTIKLPPARSGGTKPDYGTLSDNLYSFQCEINGDLYQFPMKYTDFISYGWTIDGDDTEKVDSGFYKYEYFSIGDLKCYASVVNFDINALPINECYVGGIKIDEYRTEKVKDFSMRLPKGIEYGKSTVEEIKTAYGEPSYFYEGEYYTSLKYSYAVLQTVKIHVSAETGFVNEIEIQSLAEPEDLVTGEVGTEVPEIVKKYKAPDKLDDNFDTFTVQYGGHLYKLPAPVSCFIANGWEISKKDSDMYLAGRGYGIILLTKEYQKLRATVKNYSEMATIIENCFVTLVKSGDSDNKTEIIIPRNIKLEMSESEVEKALKGVEYKKDTLYSTYNRYLIEPVDFGLYCYKIYTDKGTVHKIEVNYEPHYDDYMK